MGYDEILKLLTVDCKDDGSQFTVTDRVDNLKSLLDESDYTLAYEGKLALVYVHKELADISEAEVLISSHIDTVYERLFCEEGCDDMWLGTFDNSATNAAIVEMMLNKELPHSAIIAFTGDEEHDSAGAYEVMDYLYDNCIEPKMAIVTDVTNVGWEEEAEFTIENDNDIDILTGFNIVNTIIGEEYQCSFKHNAEPDETWDYIQGIEGGCSPIPCLSVCMPAGGELHGEEGVFLRKSSVKPYQAMIKKITEL